VAAAVLQNAVAPGSAGGVALPGAGRVARSVREQAGPGLLVIESVPILFESENALHRLRSYVPRTGQSLQAADLNEARARPRAGAVPTLMRDRSVSSRRIVMLIMDNKRKKGVQSHRNRAVPSRVPSHPRLAENQHLLVPLHRQKILSPSRWSASLCPGQALRRRLTRTLRATRTTRQPKRLYHQKQNQSHEVRTL